MCISNQCPSAKATPFGEPLSWRLSSHLSNWGAGQGLGCSLSLHTCLTREMLGGDPGVLEPCGLNLHFGL